MNCPDDVDFGFDVSVHTDLPRTHWMALNAYATANGTTVSALLRATAVHILTIAGAAAIDGATPAPVRPTPSAPVHLPAPSVPEDEPAAAEAPTPVVDLRTVTVGDVRRPHGEGLNDVEITAELRSSVQVADRPRHINLGLPKNVPGPHSKQQRTA